MRIAAALFAACIGLAAAAGSVQARSHRSGADVDTTGSLDGRAPWSQPWEYDSGSDNDSRPELPYYMQGRGQQTGGANRNLLPCDGFTLFPRC